MLSTFSNFLPQGFSFGSSAKEKDLAVVEEPDSPQQSHCLPKSTSPEPISGQIDPEQGANTKKRRERPANETFIVVRPPPSVSNHPLNLQLQLVPPRVRDRSLTTESQSLDNGLSNASDELTRVESIRSNRSDASVYASSVASTTSIASSSSTSTASSSRRMIIPLYNLCAHNVLTNTIVDAGTDAKIVKFNKRGMEVIGLAVLEPKEVWTAGGSYSDESQILNLNSGAGNRRSALLDPASAAMFNPNNGRPNSMAMASTTTNGMLDVPHTPESSVLSLSSAGGEVEYMKAALSATPTQENPHASPSSSGPKKLFGKIFKRGKDAGSSSGGAGTATSGAPSGPSTPVPRKKLSMNSIGVHSRGNTSNSHIDEMGSSSAHPYGPSGSTNTSMPPPSILQPPILGIHPTLVSLHHPPIGRPTRYVWVVTKWLKGSGEGMLSISGMMGKLNVGGNGDRSPSGTFGGVAGGSSGVVRRLGGEDVEVRVEWVRAKAGSRRRGSAFASTSGAGGGSGLNRRMSQHVSNGNTRNGSQTSLNAPGLVARRTSLRASMDSRRSRSPTYERERERERDRASAHSSEENEGTTASRGSHGGHDNNSDGEESDPEDSETPWSCTLTISERAHVVARRVALERERERAAAQQHQQQGSAHGHSRTGSQSQYAQYPSTPHTSMSLQHPPRAPGARPSSSRPSSRPSSANPNAPTPIHTQNLHPLPHSASHPHPHHTPTSSIAGAMTPTLTPGTASASSSTPQTIRIKLGQLSPAPHHPKVVAQLKVPFPLPDIEVDGMRIVPRVVSPSGVARSNLSIGTGGNGGGGGELVLTAEEIKDVLSATAFWLVVREGFGGVGKVSRKGDGWRIRG